MKLNQASSNKTGTMSRRLSERYDPSELRYRKSPGQSAAYSKKADMLRPGPFEEDLFMFKNFGKEPRPGRSSHERDSKSNACDHCMSAEFDRNGLKTMVPYFSAEEERTRAVIVTYTQPPFTITHVTEKWEHVCNISYE